MVEDTNVQETEVKSGNTPAESDSKSLFSIEILRLIRDAQKQHGLRHGDFQRYRGMCIKIIISKIKVGYNILNNTIWNHSINLYR